MAAELCGICGGDGRIANSFGNQTRCPSCHGSGRRSDDGGLRDVTKTKPSHHRGASTSGTNKAQVVEKQTWPSTFEGGQLANEVKACATLSNDTKAKLTREIIDHEASHGTCTQTFVKKVRKQLRPASS
jgi:hypothetical protein